MLINIRTSKENHNVVQELSRKYIGTKENFISRLAFSYSISKGIKLDLENDLKDSQGKEYKEDVLFGNYKSFFIALVCQHYGIGKSDKDMAKYIKMHIDHGLTLMNKLFAENPNYSAMEFLTENIERGIERLSEYEVSNDAILFDESTRRNRIANKEYYSDLIKILVGRTLNDEEIYFNLNDTSIHNNAMVAVAGNPGTGKTYFANRFLEQVVEQSNEKVNFIFLDFKGLKKEDEKALEPFFNKTKAIYLY
jgi:DNA sulfur modification protein DndE